MVAARALTESESLRSRTSELAVASGGMLLARIRRILGLLSPNDCRAPGWLAGPATLALLAGLTVTVLFQPSSGDEGISATPSRAGVDTMLNEVWNKLDQLEDEQHKLAKQKWDALNVVPQATIILRGWDQAEPLPRQLQAVQSEQGARRFLAEAQRQLGPHWQAHLAQEMMDTLSRKERRAFEKARNSVIEEIAPRGQPAVPVPDTSIRTRAGGTCRPATCCAAPSGKSAQSPAQTCRNSTDFRTYWAWPCALSRRVIASGNWPASIFCHDLPFTTPMHRKRAFRARIAGSSLPR